MSKLKTKSAVKKRFKLTSKGMVIATQSGKNHMMRRRSKKQLRNLRGTTILNSVDSKNLKKFFLPYGL